MCIDSEKSLRQSNRPITGYRVFELDRGRLQSLYWEVSSRASVGGRRKVWRRSEVTTDDPTFCCDFGFHAFRTLAAARDWRTRSVYAKVRGHGKVVRHLTGFRSSRMTILNLYVSRWAFYSTDGVRRAVRQLKKAYGVPVVVIE